MTKMKDKLFNHAGKKREIVEILINHFEDSGVEYTCTAVFYKVCGEIANKYARGMVDAGYNFSKSKYYPYTSTADIFLSAANKEYFIRHF